MHQTLDPNMQDEFRPNQQGNFYWTYGQMLDVFRLVKEVFPESPFDSLAYAASISVVSIRYHCEFNEASNRILLILDTRSESLKIKNYEHLEKRQVDKGKIETVKATKDLALQYALLTAAIVEKKHAKDVPNGMALVNGMQPRYAIFAEEVLQTIETFKQLGHLISPVEFETTISSSVSIGLNHCPK